MTEYDIIIDFVKTFYIFTVAKQGGEKIIFIHDSLERPETKKVYWVGEIFETSIYFVWDKAKDMTGIDINKKENYEVLSFLNKCLRCAQTMSFIKFVLDSLDKETRKYSFSMKSIPEEFPLIFVDEENQFSVEMS